VFGAPPVALLGAPDHSEVTVNVATQAAAAAIARMRERTLVVFDTVADMAVTSLVVFGFDVFGFDVMVITG
jgi:hypothetical protein